MKINKSITTWWLGLLLVCDDLLRTATTTTSTTSDAGILFRRYPGIQLTGPCDFVLNNIPSFSMCMFACEKQMCNAGSYHSGQKTCCVGSGEAFDHDATYAEDANSVFFQKFQDYIYYDGWALAFRACAACGKSVYGAWSDSSQQDDALVGTSTLLPWGCITLKTSMTCSRHFRSKLLDNWASLGVKQVSLRMYKSGSKVVDVIFNGSGSTVSSWMSPSRLLQSPWTDANTSPSTYNIFGINIVPQDKRYFFINKSYGGCNIDSGWMVALDVRSGTPACSWENRVFPAYVYSSATTYSQWRASAVRQADVMAVFVKF